MLINLLSLSKRIASHTIGVSMSTVKLCKVKQSLGNPRGVSGCISEREETEWRELTACMNSKHFFSHSINQGCRQCLHRSHICNESCRFSKQIVAAELLTQHKCERFIRVVLREGLQGGGDCVQLETCNRVAIFWSIAGPPVADQSDVKKIGRIGETVRLTCPISGYPAPMVEWTKNGEKIDFTWERHRY